MKRILSIFMIASLILSMAIITYGEDKKVTSPEEIIEFKDSNLEKVVRTTINKMKGNILAEDLRSIKKFHADGKSITSLEGIEYLTNLEELSLKENNITDITPLIGLKKLKSLNLWKNSIKDITPLSNLSNLTSLDLDSNQIQSIYPLKDLSNLKALRLGSNRLTDISPLANLKKLDYLCLWANRVRDIKPIGDLENLTRLRLAYNEIIDISPLANLNRLENINLFNNNITNISALGNLSGLKRIYLMENEINNIDPLSSLKNLERLRLDNNDISNINGLKNLKNLKLLTLSKNNITSLAPLIDMKKLEYLDLQSNKINSLYGLEGITSLTKLFLDDNNIYDISALINKEKLITLSLAHNNIEDIRPINSLRNLKLLDLSSNKIEELDPLKILVELKSLYLANNLIMEIEPLKENVKLENLSLQNNYISEIDILSNLTNLINLDLANNKIKDIGALKETINLKRLTLYNNRIEDFIPLRELKNLEIIRTSDYVSSKDMITVTGKVTDLYNDEYKGENTYVTMINLSGNDNVLFMDKTNKYGEFKINRILPGQYKITFTKKGYKSLNIFRTIDYNNKEINVKLELAKDTKWINKVTDRMVYSYKEGMLISDVEIGLQEKRLKEIEDFFGVKVNDKINFYICTYPEEIYELAYDIKDHYTVGTYKFDTNTVYTLGKAFDFHETCHAVEQKFNPNYNISLGEGLAVYFGSDQIGRPVLLNRSLDDLARELMIKGELKDIRTLLKNFEGDNDYIASGSFVTFLLQKYEVEQFREVFKLLPKKPTEDKINKVFMKVYSKTIEQIQDEWLADLK